MMAEVNLAFSSSSEALASTPVMEKRPADVEANASTDSGVQSETSFDMSCPVELSDMATNGTTLPAPQLASSDLGPSPAFLPPLKGVPDVSFNPPAPWMLPPLDAEHEKKAPPPSSSEGDDHAPEAVAKEGVSFEEPTTDTDVVPYLPTDCGFCCMCLKRSCLRRMAHPVSFLLLISLLVLIQSFVVSGYTNSITTTIEKRYDIQTTWIGLIISTYDVACIFATFFVSYYANRMNRARFLGGSTLVLLAGLVVWTIPHFTTSAYSPVLVGPSRVVFVCNATSNTGLLDVKRKQCALQSAEPWAKWIFLLGQVIVGVGASPIYIIGPTYLYDILHPLQYPIYSACMYVAGALGPALGFVLGSSFLSIYIDWPKAATSTINRNHSQWLGAWWIGYLLSAGLGLFVALPLLAFPASFPDWLRRRRERGERIGCLAVSEKTAKEEAKEEAEREAEEGSAQVEKKEDEAEGYKSFRNFPKAVLRILSNPVWLFITLLSVEEQFVASAFVSFIQKYLQTTYGLPAYRASIIAGAVVIPSAVLGVVIGAVIIRQMKLNLVHTASFLVGLCVVTTSLMIALMFMGCDSFRMAGLQHSYNATPMASVNFTDSCNVACGCSEEMYSPVCDTATRTTFFSPCHAGCSGQSINTISGSTFSNFSSCSCIRHRSVSDGRCEQNCPNKVTCLVLVFFVILVTSFGQDPAHIVTISSVASADRSFGLGMQVLAIRLLAYVPAPIVFGYIFDSVCILWTRTCANTQGSCREYDLRLLPFVWIGVLIGLKVLGVVFSFSLLLFSKKRASIAISVVVTEAEANKSETMRNTNQKVLDGTLPSLTEDPDKVTHLRVRRVSSTTMHPRFASPVPP